MTFDSTPFLHGPPRVVLDVTRSGLWSTDQSLQTPSDFFHAKYPSLTKKFGPAFLEVHFLDSDGFLNVACDDINIDLFAAITGGTDHKTRIVYYRPEQEFYGFDRSAEHFKIVAEERLKFGLSQELISCASYMSQHRPRVQIINIFKQFRTEEVLGTIIERSKGLLGVDASFFDEESKNSKDPTKLTGEQTAKIFALEVLDRKKGEMLTVAAAYVKYVDFCQGKNMTVVLHRNEFRAPAVEAVRNAHGMGLSKDLNIDGKWTSGWRNLEARVIAA